MEIRLKNNPGRDSYRDNRVDGIDKIKYDSNTNTVAPDRILTNYASEGSQPLVRGASFCNGRNSTAIVQPKNNLTTNISAESCSGAEDGAGAYGGGDRRAATALLGNTATAGIAASGAEAMRIQNVQGNQQHLYQQRALLHPATASAPDSKQYNIGHEGSNLSHKSNFMHVQSQQNGIGNSTSTGKVTNDGTVTQHDPLMYNYSSTYKPSQHILSTGSGNLMTSQGKEGVVAAECQRVGERELGRDNGVVITQFVPQLHKMPSPSPRNRQSSSRERRTSDHQSLTLPRQPSAGADSRAVGSSVHSNSQKQGTPATGCTGTTGQYTTGQKAMKHQNRYSEHFNGQAGLHSQRNYSGSLHKAPSGSSYQTQRTVQVAKNQKTSKNVAVGSNKHQLSGTAGSDSTGASRSGGRANGSTQANASSSLVSGIPIHPKMTKQYTALGTIGIPGTTKHHQGAKASSGDFVTNQQQTPQMLSTSNSHAGLQHRHKQYYNSNSNTQYNSQSLRTKGPGGVPDKSITTVGVSSQYSQQKIQKFDFTHYDGQIEEQLRIPIQRNGQADKKMKANSSRGSAQPSMGNSSAQKSLFTARGQTSTHQQTITNDQQRRHKTSNQEEPVNTGQTTPDMLTMAQQMNSDRRSETTGEAKKVDEEVPSSNYGHILPINEQKMRQLQEGILQVRVGMGMMSSGQSGGNGLDKGSTEAKNENDYHIERTENQNFQPKKSSRNDLIKNNEQAQLKALNSSQNLQQRDRMHNSSNAHGSAPGPSDDSKQEELDENAQNLNTAQIEQKDQLLKGCPSLEKIIHQNHKLKSRYSNHQLEPSKSAQNLGTTSQTASQKIGNSEKGSNRSGHSGGQKQSSQMKPPVRSNIHLQIAIPDDNEEKSTKQQSNQKSEDSNNFLPGEENLAPSTEKKIDKKSLNPNNIPKTGTHFGQVASTKNIFLNKFQCNSARNNANLRYQNVDSKANVGGKFDFGDVDDSDIGDETENDDKRKNENHQISISKDLKPIGQISAERGSSHGPPAAKAGAVASSASKAGTSAAQTLSNVKNQFLHTASQAHSKPEQRQLGARSGSESNFGGHYAQKPQPSNQQSSKQGAASFKTIDEPSQDSRFSIQPAHKIIIPNDEPTKTSNKRNGVVRAYAANTNQGLVRNYNEDRVSIITNLLPPKHRKDIDPDKWPRCSYFGIYDGHGGSLCADFLRDNLHHYVINESSFPQNPKEAIVTGFAKAEKAFMEKIYNPITNELKDKSGSCAIVVLIVQDMCYVANVGDSRAVLSSEEGRRVYPLSLDHKPGEDSEAQRIRDAGGEIYYRTATNQIITYDKDKMNKYQQFNLAGPLRVLPGRLSVARTFGDPEAKIRALNGNPNVVIHNPEIKSFQIRKEHDFIVLGCDGIFDKMSNVDSVSCVWRAAYDNKHHQSVKGQVQDVHKMCGMGIEYILKNSLLRRSLDNVTVVIIGFNNFKHALFGHAPQQQTSTSRQDQADKVAAIGQLKEEEKKAIDTKAALQSQNSQGQLKQSSHTKLQSYQQHPKTIERTKSANLPKHQIHHQQIKQQQLKENSALKIQGTSENDIQSSLQKKMSNQQNSQIGASRSSISTMSTMGHGAAKNSHLKLGSLGANNENDDPNLASRSSLKASKSKEILRQDTRMQQLLQQKQQLNGQFTLPQQQIKSARLSSNNYNGTKPPMASQRVVINNNQQHKNQQTIQKSGATAPHQSFHGDISDKRAFLTSAGSAAGTLVSSQTQQNLHNHDSANISGLKSKYVPGQAPGYQTQPNHQPDSHSSSTPVQIHQNLNQKGGSRSLVRLQQKKQYYSSIGGSQAQASPSTGGQPLSVWKGSQRQQISQPEGSMASHVNQQKIVCLSNPKSD